jgi:hypothetical protein
MAGDKDMAGIGASHNEDLNRKAWHNNDDDKGAAHTR